MKPQVQDELEDDLAAEEENKLINEVRQTRTSTQTLKFIIFSLRSTKHGSFPLIRA
jgi:hypothetical protein